MIVMTAAALSPASSTSPPAGIRFDPPPPPAGEAPRKGASPPPPPRRRTPEPPLTLIPETRPVEAILAHLTFIRAAKESGIRGSPHPAEETTDTREDFCPSRCDINHTHRTPSETSNQTWERRKIGMHAEWRLPRGVDRVEEVAILGPGGERLDRWCAVPGIGA